MSPPLYRRLLGPGFDALPARVRELHDLDRISVWEGRAQVERGRSLVTRMAAWLASLPPQGNDLPLRVTFAAVGDKEIWARQFGKALFRSVQHERGGLLHERVAFATFVSQPPPPPMVCRSGSTASASSASRCRGCCTPAVDTFESERDGRYQFEVEAHLPLFGLLVRYAGWLEQVVPKAAPNSGKAS